MNDKYISWLEIINRELFNRLKLEQRTPPSLYEPADYILKQGGKKIRPLLTLISADLFDGTIENALPSALAVEVFHNFTLVHDDIMDSAPVRRGKPTVHEKWGLPSGILSGDAMFVLAYELLSASQSAVIPSLLKTFNETALKVCEGQELDMIYEKSSNCSVARYINMIRLKTAALLGGAMKLGGITAGAREEDLENIYSFAIHLGIAFQLQDDILDVYGDPEKFGKRKGGDIISNKKTFLLLKAMELSYSYMKEELNNWIGATQFIEEEKVTAVTGIYDFLNVKKLAEDEMERHFDLALKSLGKIPAMDEKKKDLISLSENLMNRES